MLFATAAMLAVSAISYNSRSNITEEIKGTALFSKPEWRYFSFRLGDQGIARRRTQAYATQAILQIDTAGAEKSPFRLCALAVSTNPANCASAFMFHNSAAIGAGAFAERDLGRDIFVAVGGHVCLDGFGYGVGAG